MQVVGKQSAHYARSIASTMFSYDFLVVLNNSEASNLVKTCIHHINTLCSLPRFHVFQGVEVVSKAVRRFGASRMSYTLAVVEYTESVAHLPVIMDELATCGMICPILVALANPPGKTDSAAGKQLMAKFLYESRNQHLRMYSTCIHPNMSRSELQGVIQRCVYARELQRIHAYGGVPQRDAVILTRTSNPTLGGGLSSIYRAVLQLNGNRVTFIQVDCGWVSLFGFDLCDLHGKEICCLSGPATEMATLKKLESAVHNHENTCAFVVLYDNEANAHVQFAVVRPLGCDVKLNSQTPSSICLLSLGHPSIVGIIHSSWVIDQLIPQNSKLDHEEGHGKRLKL